MNVQTIVETKLTEIFEPVLLTVENESHQHSVPPNSETHFKVTLVSGLFDGKRPVQRHQLVYKALAEELAGPVHALALHTYTEAEWQKTNAAPASPKCLGTS